MTITAITFHISNGGRSRTGGCAVLCPDVRYASIWWTGAARPERRHMADWRSVEAEIKMTLPAGALAKDSAIVRLFNAVGAGMRYIAAVPIDIGRPELAASVLDARLQQLVLEATSMAVPN